MRATISKWGNSLGLRIPRGIAEDAGLTEGSTIDLRVENGRLIGEPIAVEDLDALLARVSAKTFTTSYSSTRRAAVRSGEPARETIGARSR